MRVGVLLPLGIRPLVGLDPERLTGGEVALRAQDFGVMLRNLLPGSEASFVPVWRSAGLSGVAVHVLSSGPEEDQASR